MLVLLLELSMTGRSGFCITNPGIERKLCEESWLAGSSDRMRTSLSIELELAGVVLVGVEGGVVLSAWFGLGWLNQQPTF